MNRVAVTGLGIVSALGESVAEFWRGLEAGKSAIDTLPDRGNPPYKFQNGAVARSFAPLKYFEEKELTFLERFAQLAAVAAREAVRQSGLDFRAGLSEKSAVITGSSVGGQFAEEEGYLNLYRHNNPRVAPLTIPRTMSNGGASRISLEHGIQGPTYTISTACSSANHAIGQAFWMIRNGAITAAIAGGSEAVFAEGLLRAWEALRVVSPDTCRPFSKGRRGLILGEGGAMLVLENWDHARARGAAILGEICGFGMSSDAYHITQPSVEGPAKAMRWALADAGLSPDSVEYINAHGTGTVVNDATESAAIRELFGNRADRLLVSSTKSMHGHTLGAAGAVEAIATILALRNGKIPPTANFTESDPACNLDVVPNTARKAYAEYALSNSFAFGGLNAVLAFRAARD
ncbi:MAG TPA: beta-ketoacyl-[acyl-carrier-protein] synthase family protein [Bryobacteraceae bacterium]|nr:beta-ketoacyl-[acyl-carrier-protein] synthase family protein [Bryobacteraceae bacterium]